MQPMVLEAPPTQRSTKGSLQNIYYNNNIYLFVFGQQGRLGRGDLFELVQHQSSQVKFGREKRI